MSIGKLPLYIISWLAGTAFFLYGRRERAPVPAICGLALMIMPYFVHGTTAFIVVAAVLIVLPFFLKIR